MSKLFSVKLLAALLAVAVLFAFAQPAAAQQQSPLAIPITGTGTAGTLNGVFTLTGFALQNGQLVANGVITGTVTNATGVVTSIVQNITAPIANITGTACQILHLEIGPIDINVLGLRVQTNRIVLDITAQSGPGNLLGNLLCAVANLLNNPNQALVGLLNQILGVLTRLP